MKLIKFALILGVGYGGYLWWTGQDALHPFAAKITAEASPSGFLPVAMPDGAGDNTVVILAPLNCPSDAAVRADELSSRLTRLGIANVRQNRYQSSAVNATSEQRAALDRAVNVLNGEIPAVFINGMGKANPTTEEVAAEYERTR